MTDDSSRDNQGEDENKIIKLKFDFFRGKWILYCLGALVITCTISIGLYMGYTYSNHLNTFRESDKLYQSSSEYKPIRLYNVGDVAIDDELEFRITKVEFNKQNDNVDISNNSKNVVIHMSIENISKSNKKYDSYDMSLSEIRNENKNSHMYRNISETTAGSLRPGEKADISLIFEVPKDKSNFLLIYASKNNKSRIRFRIGIAKGNISI